MYWVCIFRWDGLELIRWGDSFLGRTRAIPTTQAMRPNTTRPNRACEDPHQRQGITSPRKNKKTKPPIMVFVLKDSLVILFKLNHPKTAFRQTSARPSHARARDPAPKHTPRLARRPGTTHKPTEPSGKRTHRPNQTGRSPPVPSDRPNKLAKPTIPTKTPHAPVKHERVMHQSGHRGRRPRGNQA